MKRFVCFIMITAAVVTSVCAINFRLENESSEGIEKSGVFVSGVSSGDFRYVIYEYHGKVAVFDCDNRNAPLFITDTNVAGLREKDRELLKTGIALKEYSEVVRLLEDFES